MADYERLLLAKVVRERDMPGLIEARIDDRHFADEEHLRVLAWMREHWAAHGVSPSEQALRAEFPAWRFPETPEPLGYYTGKVKQAYKHDVIAQAVQDSVAHLEDLETDEAAAVLTAALADVNSTVSSMKDHDLGDPERFSELFDHYKELTKNPGALRGYATGWPTIDMATMGLQPGQLVTFVGPPKAGKSTVMLSCANHVWDHEKASVLLISFEMSFEEQRARWVGIQGTLNWRRLVKGKMNEADERRMLRVLRRLRKREREETTKFILSEDISSTTTVGGIVAKIVQFRPQVVFIDGVYLMDDENGEAKGSSQAITNITRSLKRAAQVHHIPIVISTQTLLSKMRGGQVRAASIGYSSSFGQDSDVVIAVEPREEPQSGEHQHWLKVLLSRSGPQTEVQIEFDWTTSSFTEYDRAADDDIEDEPDPDEVDDAA